MDTKALLKGIEERHGKEMLKRCQAELARPFRAVGAYDVEAVSVLSSYFETMSSLAEQSDEPFANINTMIERLGVEQVMADGYAGPVEADFAEVPDFRTALDLTIQAQREFGKLPAKVRAAFDNDPALLLESLDKAFGGDEDALKDLKHLGVIKERPQAGASGAPGADSGTPPVGGVPGAGAGGGAKP